MDNIGGHRPRNVGWARASALLYGDWGTSKAYVIGLAFVAAGYSSFPIILAVCALTGLVGYNYIIICRHFPEGGGVYSSAREQSRVLAVLGSLLLLADFIVTAAMSCWDAMSYFGIPREYLRRLPSGLSCSSAQSIISDRNIPAVLPSRWPFPRPSSCSQSSSSARPI